MSPANIEAALKGASPLIGAVCAVGDGRPYNVALVTLDPDVAAAFAEANGISPRSLPELGASEVVREEVARGIEQANRQLARDQQIKRFAIVPDEWQPGNDELTPTMKLKRPIAEKYQAEIELSTPQAFPTPDSTPSLPARTSSRAAGSAVPNARARSYPVSRICPTILAGVLAHDVVRHASRDG